MSEAKFAEIVKCVRDLLKIPNLQVLSDAQLRFKVTLLTGLSNDSDVDVVVGAVRMVLK